MEFVKMQNSIIGTPVRRDRHGSLFDAALTNGYPSENRNTAATANVLDFIDAGTRKLITERTNFSAQTSVVTALTAAINSLMKTRTCVYFPAGDYYVNDSLVFPAYMLGNPRCFYGDGRRLTVIHGVGLTGKALFRPDATGQYLNSLEMRGMSLTGDQDNAFFADPAPYLMWACYFESMSFGAAGTAFKCTSDFENCWTRCEFVSTVNGNGCEVQGNKDCWIDCSIGPFALDGVAGFKTTLGGVFISCNGCYVTGAPRARWGDFGRLASDPAGPSYPRVTLLNCNVEDYGDYGLYFQAEPRVIIHNTTFTKLSGTTIAPMGSAVGAWASCVLKSILINLTGSTLDAVNNPNNATIVIGSGTISVESDATITSWNGTTLRKWSPVSSSNTAFQPPLAGGTGYQVQTHFAALSADYVFPGSMQPASVTIFTGATLTITTASYCYKTNNSGATNFSLISAVSPIVARDGMLLLVIIGDANTTVIHNTASANRMLLKSGGNETPAAGTLYVFVRVTATTSRWQQIN
jgi:hypothetical protein